jgi:hypothetical protein
LLKNIKIFLRLVTRAFTAMLDLRTLFSGVCDVDLHRDAFDATPFASLCDDAKTRQLDKTITNVTWQKYMVE